MNGCKEVDPRRLRGMAESNVADTWPNASLNRFPLMGVFCIVTLAVNKQILLLPIKTVAWPEGTSVLMMKQIPSSILSNILIKLVGKKRCF